MKDGNRVEVRSQSLCTKNIYDKKRQSSIASTEQILESIDKILEERNEFVDLGKI